MNDTRLCPRCGTDLPAGATEGSCPRCQVTAPLGAAPDNFDVAALAAQLPQFDILGPLGRGGMGVVYKARQKSLDRPVAIKVLPPGAEGNSEFAERFSREARAMARLSHPNIVAVHDFGRASGTYYLVMEFVEGVNLRQAVRDRLMTYTDEANPNPAPGVVNGRVDVRIAAQLMSQACEAIQYAHDLGVVHRDIKPENLLVHQPGRVKVADFGLAKLLGRGPQDHTLTATGQAMGTFHYMAPEQLERPGEVDHRADLYALGVVFYELLTGELPLGRFDAPSRKANVPPAVDRIALRLLEKNPSLRYQQAREVKADLDALYRPSGEPRHGPSPHVMLYPWLVPMTLGLSFLAWMLTGLLWELRWPGLVLAAGPLGALFLFAARRTLRAFPEAERAMSQRRPAGRGVRWGASAALFLASCAILLFTQTNSLDNQMFVLAAEVYPPSSTVFDQRYRGLEHDVLKPLAAEYQLALTQAGRPANSRLILRSDFGHYGAALDRHGAWLVLVYLGAIAMAVAAGVVLGIPLRPFWHGSFGLTAMLLGPFSLATSPLGVEPSRVDFTVPHATFDVGKDQVVAALERWAGDHGYELLGDARYVVEPVPGPGDLGRAGVYHLRKASAFDRSQFSWGRPRRRTPDLAVLLLSCNNPVRTALVVVPVTTAPVPAPASGYAGRDIAVSLGDELRRSMR